MYISGYMNVHAETIDLYSEDGQMDLAFHCLDINIQIALQILMGWKVVVGLIDLKT